MLIKMVKVSNNGSSSSKTTTLVTSQVSGAGAPGDWPFNSVAPGGATSTLSAYTYNHVTNAGNVVLPTGPTGAEIYIRSRAIDGTVTIVPGSTLHFVEPVAL